MPCTRSAHSQGQGHTARGREGGYCQVTGSGTRVFGKPKTRLNPKLFCLIPDGRNVSRLKARDSGVFPPNLRDSIRRYCINNISVSLDDLSAANLCLETAFVDLSSDQEIGYQAFRGHVRSCESCLIAVSLGATANLPSTSPPTATKCPSQLEYSIPLS